MFCTNCGKRTEPVDSRCTRCGFDLTAVMALLDEPDDDDLDSEDVPRSAEEIAKRALTLSAVVSCAYRASKQEVIDWLKQEDLWLTVTPKEREFLERDASEQARRDFTWKVEALVPLLWAIGKLDTMPGVAQECDMDPVKQALVWPPTSTAAFIRSAAVRDEDEISIEYEKVYDAHWKARDAKLKGKQVPRGIHAGVVQRAPLWIQLAEGLHGPAVGRDYDGHLITRGGSVTQQQGPRISALQAGSTGKFKRQPKDENPNTDSWRYVRKRVLRLFFSSRDGLTLTRSRARPEVPEVRARYAGEANAH